jgi:hypothetical protein
MFSVVEEGTDYVQADKENRGFSKNAFNLR